MSGHVEVERMDDPVRAVTYRVYRHDDYRPTNDEARLLLERIRHLRGRIARYDRLVTAAIDEELGDDIVALRRMLADGLQQCRQ